MADPWTLARWGLVALMLSIGVVLDLRTRRVPNRVWLPFLGLGVLFAARDLAVTPDKADLLVPYGIAAVLCGLLYLLWRLRLFGGADAKALMVAALLCPFPLVAAPGPRLPAFPPAFDALMDGTLVLMLYPLFLLVWNLAHGRARFPAAFLGLPMTLAEARNRHVWPMQRVGEDGTLRWQYWQKIGGDLDEAYLALERAGVDAVWVTPKIPFLVPLALGWVLAGTLGNLALYIVAQSVA